MPSIYFSHTGLLVLTAVCICGMFYWYHRSDNQLRWVPVNKLSKPCEPATRDLNKGQNTQDRSSRENRSVVKCTRADRLTMLQNVCKGLRAEDHPHLSKWIHPREYLHDVKEAELKNVVKNLISDDHHRILYCAIAKAGCSSFKYHLLKNTPKWIASNMTSLTDSVHSNNYLKEFGLKRLNQFSKSDILFRLDNYFTFMNVRHPLDRIVSTYNEKLVMNNKIYQKSLGRRLIKTFRKNPSNEALETGEGVMFSEFMKMIATEKNNSSFLDPHWENYFKSCFPCLIRYDYISKLETSEYDMPYLISEHLSGNFIDELRNVQRSGSINLSHGERIIKEYGEVDWQLFHQVLQYYQVDMDMFGYSGARDTSTGQLHLRCGQMEGGCC